MNDTIAPKSILLMAANPKGTVSLRLQEEEREIRERLRLAGYGKVPIHSTGATRPRDMQQAMLDFKPQVVHFTGHGSGKDGLAFEDGAGQLKLVDSDALANLFKLFSSRVECVVLNACYSQFQAEAIAQHIDYVIGMSQTIGDRAAIEFAVGFYAALGAGEAIEFAYELGCNAIQLEGIPEHLTPVLVCKQKDKSVLTGSQNLDKEGSLTEPAVEAFLTTTPPQTAEEFYEQGRKKYDAGDYQGAIVDYSEAIRFQPNYAEAYTECGRAKSRLEDYEGAIAEYTKAICFQPDNPDTYTKRGEAKRNLKDCRGAFLDFDEAIRLQPDNFNAYKARGATKALNHDDYGGALADLTHAINLQPDGSHSAYFMRSFVKRDLGDHQGQISDLNEAIRDAIRFQSDHPPILFTYYYMRWKAKQALGDNLGTYEDLNEMIRLKPNLDELYSCRGKLKSELGDRQGAIADYQESMRLCQQKGYTERYGEALKQIKKLEEESKNKGFWDRLFS
jgi:tetratricopeptide (TPR) repeat protein